MSAGKRHRIVLWGAAGVLGAAVLIYLTLGESAVSRNALKLDPGTINYQTDPNEIRSFVYSNAIMTMAAKRQKAGMPFSIEIHFTDRRPPQNCMATSSLTGLLSNFSTIRVKRQVEKEDMPARYPAPLGTVEIQDAIASESMPPWKFFGSSDSAAVAVEQQSVFFETDIPSAVFKKLEAGCAELSTR